ncbi:MAG: peptide-methionine (S)-S-oxide reductase MsrA [Coriobacteriales bacterium]|nr:peptide-methionine (S)-S-oxide reductase MsrA [Coriobacteriales bacterium]
MYLGETKEIYFAGGCFWGVEDYFALMPGVVDVTCGYAQGHVENPTYEQVCSHTTGHAETVHVTYYPSIISLTTLCKQFFMIIDPLSVNKQGNDVSDQYRTGIYYVDEADLPVIQAVFESEQGKYEHPIVTELEPLRCYYLAEDYHQDYLVKNPDGYCHVNFATLSEVRTEQQLAMEAAGSLDPGRYVKPSDSQLRESLTDEQYRVTQRGYTEEAFVNDYWDFFEPGLYVGIVTGEPLFSSSDKFRSKCGWPSFCKPISEDVLVERLDLQLASPRTEVRSRVGDSHLGHVFTDGPAELGGLRYCIDSAALEFIPYDSMEARGYADLMPLCEAASAD